MLATADGRYETAVYLLALAIVLDTLDGNVARWLRATSQFGQEMDSFSDAISFGAAPSFLLYMALLKPLGMVGFVVSMIYLLSGVYRLARFNLTTDAHTKDQYSTGVPIPVGAGYLMATVLMRDEISPWVGSAVALTFAILMMSRITLPNLKGRNIVTAMLFVGMMNYLLVISWPNWYTVIWWNIWNAAILIVAARRHTNQSDDDLTDDDLIERNP